MTPKAALPSLNKNRSIPENRESNVAIGEFITRFDKFLSNFNNIFKKSDHSGNSRNNNESSPHNDILKTIIKNISETVLKLEDIRLFGKQAAENSTISANAANRDEETGREQESEDDTYQSNILNYLEKICKLLQSGEFGSRGDGGGGGSGGGIISSILSLVGNYISVRYGFKYLTKNYLTNLVKSAIKPTIKGVVGAEAATKVVAKEGAEAATKSIGRGVLRSTLRGAGVGALTEGAFAVYEYKEEKERLEQLEKDRVITKEEKEGRLENLMAEKTGSGVGGAVGGALGGAAVGALVGSVVPVVGTIIGGIVGAVAGGIIGSMAGEAAGGLLSDAMSETSLTEEELKEKIETRSLVSLGGEVVGGQKGDTSQPYASVASPTEPRDLEEIKQGSIGEYIEKQTNNNTTNNIVNNSNNSSNAAINTANHTPNSTNAENVVSTTAAGNLQATMPA